MAIGKCSDEEDIEEANVVIRFGDQELYPSAVGADGLKQLTEYLRGTDVRIHVSLGIGQGEATVWGCDLTAGYISINADYST
jgi:glutamate N-acetyltransferase/amino-acid N-acetyltransferase